MLRSGPRLNCPFTAHKTVIFFQIFFQGFYSQMFINISTYEDVHVCAVGLLLCASLQNGTKLNKKTQLGHKNIPRNVSFEQTDIQTDSKLTTAFFPFSEGGTLPGW